MELLSEQTAVVTGAATGIGRAIAESFAAEGASLTLVDLSAEGLEEVATTLRERGARCLTVVANVGDDAAVRAFVAATVREFGGIDVLVNNAGTCWSKPLVEMTTDEWQRMLEVDLTSVFLTSRAVLPTMIERGHGRIINVGSQLAMNGSEGMTHYCAAKGGVHSLTRALAREVAEHGITVNVIAPGPTETPLMRTAPKDWLDAKQAELPLGRFARPEEIAPTAVLLASAGGGYYTGATLNVSGGDVMA